MKRNRGITLVSLIVVIVVIIILASVTIYYGLSQNREKAVETKSVYEVVSFLDAVNSRALMHRINPNYYTYVGDLNYSPISIGNDTNQVYSSGDNWYLLSDKSHFTELGIDNITGEYLVNYDKGLVVSVNGIRYDETTYYSLNELKKVMGGGSMMLANAEYDSVKKVNKPVLATGMVPVKLSGGSWVVADKEDADWYDYSKEQEAWANVMLKDGLKVEGYTNDELREAPLEDLVGKKVSQEGSAYVWIPRYTATSIDGTGSKIIFSHLTEDTYTYNNDTYILPSAFTYSEADESIDLTGIWVSKYEASFDR